MFQVRPSEARKIAASKAHSSLKIAFQRTTKKLSTLEGKLEVALRDVRDQRSKKSMIERDVLKYKRECTRLKSNIVSLEENTKINTHYIRSLELKLTQGGKNGYLVSKIESLRKKVNSLQTERTTLQNKLSEKNSETEVINEEITILKNAVKIRAKSMSNQSRLAARGHNKNNVENTISSELLIELAKSQKQKKTLVNQVSDLTGRLNTIECALAEEQDASLRLARDRQIACKAQESLSKQLSNQSVTINTLKKEINKLVVDRDGALDYAQDLSDRVCFLVNELEELKSIQISQKDELEKAFKTVAEADKRQKITESTFVDVKQKAHDELSTICELLKIKTTRVENLEKEMLILNGSDENSLGGMRNHIQYLKTELEKSKDGKRLSDIELNNTKHSIQSLNTKLSCVTGELNALKRVMKRQNVLQRMIDKTTKTMDSISKDTVSKKTIDSINNGKQMVNIVLDENSSFKSNTTENKPLQ